MGSLWLAFHWTNGERGSPRNLEDLRALTSRIAHLEGRLPDGERLVRAMETSASALASINQMHQREIEQRDQQIALFRQSAAKVDASLTEIQKAIDRTRTSAVQADVVRFVADKLIETGEAANPVTIGKIVGEFVAARGIKAIDTATEQLTKKAFCALVHIGCDPMVTVNAPVTVMPPAVTITSPPVSVLGPPTVVLVEKSAGHPAPLYGGGELQLFTSVWFEKSNSIDDGGALEQAVVPRIRQQIAARKDCGIFVSGNADAMGADDYNKDLSKRRAARVYQVLNKHFGNMVDSALGSFGERNLYRWTADASPSVYNRRVDIQVLCK